VAYIKSGRIIVHYAKEDKARTSPEFGGTGEPLQGSQRSCLA
jgi:hypothetical protein